MAKAPTPEKPPEGQTPPPAEGEKSPQAVQQEQADPQINMSPGDRDPANISQREPETPEDGSVLPQLEGSTAGDLNAGEGNDALIGGGDTTSTSNSAGARTQDGPSQKHLNQDTVREIERTDDAMGIALTEGQSKEAVEGRVADELGNLAVDQSSDNTFRTATNEVAYAAPGTKNASNMGVQQDASGHFESIAHTRSSASGTRV